MVESETRYRAFLETLGQDRLKRTLTPVAARDARTISAGGGTYVNLAGNDYLGLRFHEAPIARARDWAKTYGTGSGASRLVTGHLDLFEALEDKVARLKDKPAALLMASGFQANAAVLQALFDRAVLGAEPLVFADPFKHPSMQFGCKAAGGRHLRYRQGDAGPLAQHLAQH
ncbi:MAG: aminotransferase class I/II-fold pyridoxal phosphate-dependent enzyme, partial [Alphaproteobacteria bacterium]